MFKVNPLSLNDLLRQIESGAIQLPDFQRGWVWDDERIRGLLVSISRSFPIGAIMTLEAGGDIRFQHRSIEGVNLNGGVEPDEFLLDGQQRLTSLYQALRHDDPVATKDRRNKKVKLWYYIDMLKAIDPNVDREDAIVSVPEDKRVTRDFGRETVLDLSSPEHEYEQHMVPTERLLSGNYMAWMLAYLKHWDDKATSHPAGTAARLWEDFNECCWNNFNDYDLPVIQLDKDTAKEAVCTIFEKVNTGRRNVKHV